MSATPRPRDRQRHDAFDSAWLRDSPAHTAEASQQPRRLAIGMPGAQLRLKPPEFRRVSVRGAIPSGRQGDIHKARTAPAPAGADTACVDANGPKQSLVFAGPLITQTPKLQVVSANTSAGDKFLYLGLKDQATKFGEQVVPLRQCQAHLLCRKPHDPPLEPANLDRLHFSPAVLDLELDYPTP
jgi:hypothetical protein